MFELGILVAAYVLGSLAFSPWIARSQGVDLRRHGSGNLGATNVYRVLGWRFGVPALALDVLKGAAAVWLALAIRGDGWGGALPAVAGLMAVVGHMATPFAGFRGGKGVATGLGVFLALSPEAAVLAFGVWLGAVLLTGWISLGSGLAAIALPVFVLATRDALGSRGSWVALLGGVLAVLVVWRHRQNWRRIAEGREQAIWERRRETPDGGAEPGRGGEA